MDPCNAPIPSGFYGSKDGILMRLKINFTLGGAAENGYLWWFPQFHNEGQDTNSPATDKPANLFAFSNANADLAPSRVNMGLGTLTTTGLGLQDPAWKFVASDTCQDARTIAACLRVTYQGNNSQAQGLMSAITNLPLQATLYGGVGATPPSVSQMTTYAPKNNRAFNGLEVKFRPDESSIRFKTDEVFPVFLNASPDMSELGDTSEYFSPTAIGVTWRNVNSPGTTLYFELTKVIEWRPELNVGLVQQRPQGVDTISPVNTVLKGIERLFPDWQTHAAAFGQEYLANMLANLALGGGAGGSIEF